MFNEFNVPFYVAIISTISAIVIGVINVFASRKKQGADAIHMITQSYVDLIDASNARVQRLEDRISSLEEDVRVGRDAMIHLEEEYQSLKRRMRDWSRGIQILIAQIERHNETPEWRPAKESNDGN